MSEPAEPSQSEPLPASAMAEVDAVLAEFNGDARAAIAALLHDLDALAADQVNVVSFGYVRGQRPRTRRPA